LVIKTPDLELGPDPDPDRDPQLEKMLDEIRVYCPAIQTGGETRLFFHCNKLRPGTAFLKKI
jgi:hypothetical protein